ncbi:MAG: hydroxyisourate hydrolase [Acidobacteria bacterium]|nr:hydroxyisourate hydrolase [Acidobacteriota bacterium]
MARLSTHVLDTASGRPAEGIAIALYRVTGAAREKCAETITNRDGRTDAPLLSGDRIPAGVYELIFAAGSYLEKSGAALTDPPFLDDVVIRFGIADEAGNYHVPLLLSAHGYTTYRGS